MYLASILSRASTKKLNCLKKEIGRSLMFIWWASIFSEGLSFKILYLATSALDIPLCCCLNKNCLFKLESWIEQVILRWCPYQGYVLSRLAIWIALLVSRIRFLQLQRSKSWFCSWCRCCGEQDYWSWSDGYAQVQPPYSKYWFILNKLLWFFTNILIQLNFRLEIWLQESIKFLSTCIFIF